MLTYLLAILAAGANASSSVLQRKANRGAPRTDNLSWKLIRDLLHEPAWFGGIAAITAGFLLQASALGTGSLAVVEPILVLELPLTLGLASRLFRAPLRRRDWAATAAMTAGLVGLLYSLAPSPGRATGVAWTTWVAGVGANLVLVAWGRRGPAGPAAWPGGSANPAGSDQDGIDPVGRAELAGRRVQLVGGPCVAPPVVRILSAPVGSLANGGPGASRVPSTGPVTGAVTMAPSRPSHAGSCGPSASRMRPLAGPRGAARRRVRRRRRGARAGRGREGKVGALPRLSASVS